MMQLTFTQQQMRDFLNKEQKYKIQVIKVEYSYRDYHNKVVDEIRDLEIVYPIEIPLENFTANKTYVQLLYWSLTSVFERELQSKLLDL